MPATYVAGSLIANGATSESSSYGAVIPASAAAGDVAVVAFEVGTDAGSFTTPAGWTRLTSVSRSSSPSNFVHVYAKTLVGGDPSSTVTFTYSSSRRIVGTVSVFRGVVLTGNVGAWVSSGNSTTTTLPTLSSVPAGAMVVGLYGREGTTVTPPSFTSTPTDYTAGGESKTGYTSGTNIVSRVVYKVASFTGTHGGETATLNVSAGGINVLMALPGSDTTVYGATAIVTAAAPTADGGVPTGPVSVTGATALVVAEGGQEPVPPTLPDPGLWPPDPYRQAIRSALAIWYTVDALSGGVPVPGAQGLAPTGGTITDTIRPGVRRVLSLELAPLPGLYDLLSPEGTQLKVTCHVRYTSRDVLDIPMGVFVIDSEKSSEAAGGISITAPDKWSMIQRARFIQPVSSTVGISVTDQIVALIRGALGSDEVVNVYAGSRAIMGALTWEKDRDKAILDLAKDSGVWVYFDRDGVATIVDLPTVGASADWLIDASENGVLTSLDRERSRGNTHNVVVVESSHADGAQFATQIVWDNDPDSPTYAGTNPVTNPTSAGPFGISTFFYDTPLVMNAAAAWQTAKTILARVSGLASQVSLGQVPNPAVDAFDVIDVLPPRERYDATRVLERHVVETVTTSLTGDEQHIEGRSTRAEELDP